VGVPVDCLWQRTAAFPKVTICLLPPLHLLHSIIYSPQGINPQWQTQLQFPVAVPELALVRIIVRDHRKRFLADSFLGEATLPLTSLREGFRHVRLNAWNGEPLSGEFSLLLNFHFHLPSFYDPCAQFLTTAMIFLKISKSPEPRSLAWYSQLPLPPKPTKSKGARRAEGFAGASEITLQYTGIDSLDFPRAEIQAFASKAIALYEKVIAMIP
jgi:hypothetical protein